MVAFASATAHSIPELVSSAAWISPVDDPPTAIDPVVATTLAVRSLTTDIREWHIELDMGWWVGASTVRIVCQSGSF